MHQQVEEGVGESGHHSARWTAMMLNFEEEDPFLEVHPVVFHKVNNIGWEGGLYMDV